MSKAASRRKRAGKDVSQKLRTQIEVERVRTLFGPLHPRNQAQFEAVAKMNKFRIVFLTGPSGTGKTFLATSLAVEALQKGDIERIVITRPAVGCEEDIGFLPGTEQEKFEGWVEPFLEIVRGKLGRPTTNALIESNQIVAAPLMRMRGSTFRNSIVILDEAQNTTPGQMKMFLTRIGEGAKVFITGDEEQSDLPAKSANGLSDAISVLHRAIEDGRLVGRYDFTEDDITRDPLVREVLLSYRRAHTR